MFSNYSSSFLKDFDIQEILSMIRLKKFNSFEENFMIYSENDPITDIYFILSGKVEIRKSNKLLGKMNSGDLIGIEDALTGDNYSKSAYTIEKTTTVSVSKNEFMNFLKLHDDFHLWVLKYLSSRISLLT